MCSVCKCAGAYYSSYQDWPDHINFVNLEELRVFAPIEGHPPRRIHTLIRLVTSPCLRRVVIEVNDVYFRDIEWYPLDESLVDLVKRHKAYGNLALQISTAIDPEVIGGLLPRTARRGVLEVRFSKRPDCFTQA